MLTLSINTQKNLLAFSGGIDSTALFFLLLENKIPFDIAIVDYNQREQSKDEVAYAKSLAKKYHKKCFEHSVQLDNGSNFEKKARDIRYTFFEELIKTHGYETLMTAHQLNDRLEWFLMQLSTGAGLVELIGMQELEHRLNYQLWRPLLELSKEQLENYLKERHIQYFIDESNCDENFKRNQMRHQFSDAFINEYAKGVKQSFEYLSTDLQSLNINYLPTITKDELEIFESLGNDNLNIRIIDKSLKKRGTLLSKKQRDEIIKQKELVISHKVSITITGKHIWIAPYISPTMDKTFKEKCRVLKVPKNIRGYLFSIDFDLNELTV